MRIAAFTTMWNEEVVMFYYEGFNQWAKENDSVVDIYACYGRTDMTNAFNVGEYALFDYPDLSRYDGVVLVESTINSENVRLQLEERIRRLGIPCVIMEYKTEGFSRIYIDQEKYLNQMVHHLYEAHHVEKMCYIGGLRSNVESSFRMAGFWNGMLECGLEVRRDWVFEKTFAFDDGYDVTKQLLEHPDDFPEAIVCANDDMAAGVCEALKEEGMEPGKDCLVTGFDGYVIGKNYAPALTTVSRPRQIMAYHACQLLAEQKGIFDYEEQAELLFRKTCGCSEKSYDNEAEFRSRMFRTLNNRDVISGIITEVEEKMISGDDLEEIFEEMKHIFGRLRSGRFRILLQPQIEALQQTGYDTYRTCTKEYLLWHAGADMDGKESGHAYIYAPIHFLDHLYGILTFRDIPQLLANKELYNFTKSIGFSLENKIQKKKFATVNDKLEVLYETDYLTGAYNRHGYARHAEKMLDDARRRGAPLQVFFIDVDGLKKVNDEYGHEAGDVVIRIVGNSACQAADESAKVFRYGGDEFLVLHEGSVDPEEFIAQVEGEIANKKKIMNLPYEVGASIGRVTAYPGEEKPLEVYVKEADQIMYRIKQQRHKQRV